MNFAHEDDGDLVVVVVLSGLGEAAFRVADEPFAGRSLGRRLRRFEEAGEVADEEWSRRGYGDAYLGLR